MLLYHYATGSFDVLKTAEFRHALSDEEIQKARQQSYLDFKKTKMMLPGHYYQHISFFFEPPPLQSMSSIFPSEHLVWKKGAKLFEHVVDSSKIKHFDYYVVESPEMVELFYPERSREPRGLALG